MVNISFISLVSVNFPPLSLSLVYTLSIGLTMFGTNTHRFYPALWLQPSAVILLWCSAPSVDLDNLLKPLISQVQNNSSISDFRFTVKVSNSHVECVHCDQVRDQVLDDGRLSIDERPSIDECLALVNRQISIDWRSPRLVVTSCEQPLPASRRSFLVLTILNSQLN